ncbi:DNA helicase RecQ [Deinococcus ficus]|uniref:DNA helicase RecQ n=1 Tax=Deinococcus ficus TaxID=317577 RepID=A0A221T3A4_9DEIO|nr:DNA helicase RecQ [Deinococcus ficus]ASN83375.1 DNA helicase RecQ [Deinococcus ficus]
MTAGVLPQALTVLQRVWGYPQFRGNQGDIVQTVAGGSHALVLMPTGGGKSLCYQVPSLLRPGTGIVVSPLIALMKDQVDTLRQLGVRAAYLNSTLTASAARAVEQALQDGRLDLLYIAPERLLLPRTLDLLRQSEIALFAVDEAHCVSQWGHDFRPEYQQLSVLEQQFPQVPRMALTATADDRTRADIRRVLGLTGAPEFLSSFDRPNIQYRVTTKEQPRQQLLDFIRSEHPGDAGVVYCLSRKSVEDTAQWLKMEGLEVVAYHAGLSQQERSRAQERFLKEEGIIVVATVAFGMGIDKPNVRFVAHLDLPKSMEGYYQETGRAGRDGLPSTAWMVYGLADVVNVRRMLADSDAPPDIKRIEAAKLDALLTYCETATCRREVLLAYFGETTAGPCGNCDVCLNPPVVRDMTREAQMALSAAVRTGGRYGGAYLVDILLGKENDKNRRHRTLPTFGIGKDHDARVWRSVLRQLVSLGYLTAGPYQGLMVTAKAKYVLKGERPLLLREDTLIPRVSKRAREKAQAQQHTLTPEDRSLFLALRLWRAERATQLNVPPYTIFGDATLKAIAEQRPTTLPALGKISGIGERRLAEYGTAVLQVVRSGVHEDKTRPRGTVTAQDLGLTVSRGPVGSRTSLGSGPLATSGLQSPVPPVSVGVPGPGAVPPADPPGQGPVDRGDEQRSPEAREPRETPASEPDTMVMGSDSGPLQADAGPARVSAVSLPMEDEGRPAPALPAAPRPDPAPLPEASNDALTSAAVTTALSEVRRALARETGYAAYLIFPNATLEALAQRRPRTAADLEGTPGLGPKRIQAYGDHILKAIASALDAPAPSRGALAPTPETPAPPEAAPAQAGPAGALPGSATADVDLPALLEALARDLRAGRAALDLSGRDHPGVQLDEHNGVTTLTVRWTRPDPTHG